MTMRIREWNLDPRAWEGRGEKDEFVPLVSGLQDRIYGIGTGWTVGAKREPGMIDRPPLNAMVVGDDRGVCAPLSAN